MGAFRPVEFSGDVPVCGNVGARTVKIPKGQSMEPHEHNFAHGTMVIKGPVVVRLEKDGEVREQTFNFGDFFEIPADWMHSMSAPECDAEVRCLFAVRDEDGGVAYEVTDKHRKDLFWHQGWIDPNA